MASKEKIAKHLDDYGFELGEDVIEKCNKWFIQYIKCANNHFVKNYIYYFVFFFSSVEFLWNV